MKDCSLLASFAEKERQRFKLKVGVFLLLIQNNQILLLKRCNTGIEDDLYVVPMGGHDGKETITDAMIREAKEEANILVKPEHLKLCHLMHGYHHMPNELSFEEIDIFFRSQLYEGEIKNMEPHKCSELKFYPINKLPKNMSPCVLQAIGCTLKGEMFSEFGWGDFKKLS